MQSDMVRLERALALLHGGEEQVVMGTLGKAGFCPAWGWGAAKGFKFYPTSNRELIEIFAKENNP